MSDPIRILIADDHPLFREGVTHSLTSEPDMTVVGEAQNGQEAVTLAQSLLPDVLLLDITMPVMDGIVAARQVAATCSTIQIMMLTVSEDEDKLMEALKAGASGYVLKGILAENLAQAVRTIAAGEVFVSPRLAGGILYEMTRLPARDPLAELTRREFEVLTLVTEGLKNREIADRLYLSEKTVKSYMSTILQKLQVRSRTEAALLAQRRGLAAPK